MAIAEAPFPVTVIWGLNDRLAPPRWRGRVEKILDAKPGATA